MDDMIPVKDAKVAIIGGRDFANYAYLKRIADTYHEKHGISFVYSGGATGADTLAVQWATEREISYTVFVAQWKKYGNAAGTRRNLLIIECADVILAFPTPQSKGTWHAVNLAKRMEKPVYVFETKQPLTPAGLGRAQAGSLGG